MVPPRKSTWSSAREFLRRKEVWVRVGICVLATVILYIIMQGWAAPFEYRTRLAPLRDLHARVKFEYPDREATDDERDRARRKILCYYENDTRPLEELRQALLDDVFKLVGKDYLSVDKEVWRRFAVTADGAPADGEVDPTADAKSFQQFVEALSQDEQLNALKSAIESAFMEIDRNGLLENLQHELGEGSMQEIQVYPKGDPSNARRVSVSDVRIPIVREKLKQRLVEELSKNPEVIADPELVAQRLYTWLKPRLPVTLKWDRELSKQERIRAARNVPVVMKEYLPGEPLRKLNYQGEESTVIAAFSPLDEMDLQLLRAEHQAYVASQTWWQRVLRSISFFGMFAALFLLFTGYLYYRDRDVLDNVKHFATLVALMTATLGVMWLVATNLQWRAEIIPLTLFAMTIAIVYNVELAIVASAIVALAFSAGHGYGLGEFVILAAASSTTSLLCRSIRSRTTLVYVGLITAAAVFPTVLGVYYMLGQPLTDDLLIEALWYAGGAGFAGLCMAALLPFLERWFEVLTDISLLELSDANHPLLRELVQRAPGTYNHSINVASISEAAANAIGANGLLCRVGAYYHDIGKIRKPEYFIENQSGENKHEQLLPTMSTLVIIAHVKDGAEIARRHRLPKRIIDLIEQHHGTTLVEYFYRRAEQQNKTADSGDTVEEKDYRYPGPKPQTPEAAVMMITDAVESASRALREPTPGSIENLVQKIVKKRLDDGQFDECGITLRQLHTIQESVIKSLNAMYHSRIQYPDQQTA